MRNKSAIAVLSAVLFICTANAQKLTLLPQVGFEHSITSLNYNNLGSFAPLGGEFSPQVSLRMDYRFKQGFGPYLGVSTSRSVVSFNFTNPETGMNQFDALNGNIQLRLEGGFQYTTLPIYLKASTSSSAKSTVSNSGFRSHSSFSSGSRCSKSYSRSSSRCSGKTERVKESVSRNKGTWLRLAPSFGIGYIPSVKPDVISKTSGGQTTYEYRAGNWNTALMAGMGVEFGRKQQRLFTVSVNYFTGVGNLAEQTIVSSVGNKNTVTHLESAASGWNLRVGIPFTIGQKKPVKKNFMERRTDRPCYQFRSAYKYRLNRS